MATYLIEYGSQQPSVQEVPALIEGLGSWWHPLDSTWFLSSTVEITDVFNALKAVLGSADGLLVIDVTSRPRMWSGFPPSGTAWMNDNYE